MKRKFTFLIAAAVMLLTMIVQPGRVLGQTTATESVTLSNGSFSTDHITWTCADGNITIQQIKGSGSSAVNSSYISAPRVYKGHVLSFVGSNNYTINSISITYTGTYTGNSMTAGTAMSGNTVTDNTTDVSRTWSTASGGTHVVSSVSTTGLEAIYIQNVASSTNTQLRPTAISITYTIPSSSDPSISAEDVAIAYDATEGSIVYTLNNATGNVTAAITSGDWLELGTITESTVPFTCSANTAATARTATVKLSYPGANDKTVTVTQAGNPDAFITIAEARAQGSGNVVTKGYVTSCVGTTGYIQDATAAICVYGSELTIGDEIRVAGTLSNYNGLLEITNPTVTVVSSGNTIDPELMTIAEAVASTNQGWFIRIENATVTAITGSGNSQNTTIAQGENTIVIRGNLNITVDVNDVISLNGNIGCYNTNQIANPQNVEIQQNDDPTISAENVNIACNATEGTIEYIVNNPVSGGSLTASTSAEWLTIGTVGATVPFTCTANTAITARTATVTLTYTYNSNETVNKNVTVTQAAYEAPNYTWDLSIDQTATATTDEMTWTSNYATMAVEKYNASTNTNNYYPGTPNQSYTSTRFYKNSKLTIAPVASYAITGVVFTATTESYATAFAGSTWTNASVETSGTTITVTPTNGNDAVQAVIGGTCGFTAVSVYYVEDNTPSITASNIEIAYDATQGEIAYTLNNPVLGGSLLVTEEVDWISNATLSTTDSKVTFDCEANTNYTSREGVVTITYTYGDSQSVSKDVTVTQTAAPLIYTTIPEMFAAATSTAADVTVAFNNWVVSGVSTNDKNVFVTDGTNGFVIYGTDLSNTYSVGNILQGTIDCSLKLQNGYAQLSNVDGLTIIDGGSVVVAQINMADLSGINTGALVSYENLTCNVDNNKYYLTDGTTTLQVYNSLFAFEALEDGKTYNITGIYQQYNTTKEILPRSADDIEEVTPTVPTITVANATVNVEAAGGDGTLTVTYENITDVVAEVWFCNEAGTEEATYGWIIAEIDNQTNNVEYFVEPNDGEERTAYFKVWAYDDDMNEVYSNLVTVTQDEYIAPTYAELPFSFNGGRADIENTDGLSQEGLGTDYSTNYTKLKFDGTGDWLLLQFQERPGTLTFNIKGNSFSGSTFKVQTSEDGITYTDLETYTELGDTQDESFDNLGENVRYIKWIYTEKSSGNVGLGNIALAEYAEPVASITLSSYSITDVPAISATPGTAITETLTVTVANIESFDINNLGADFCNSDGSAISGQKPDFIGFEFEENPTATDSYILTCTFEENSDPEARTAYFKVTYNEDEVVSQVVTATQLGYDAPVASITVDPNMVETSYEEIDGTLGIILENITISQVEDHFEVYFCDENGTIITEGKPNWLTGEVQLENNVFSLYYMIDENTTSEARTAYMKVYGLSDDGNTEAYSNKITFTQAGATGPVTTGTIVFGNNGTKINDVEVTGDDSMGNTWTITTVFGAAGQSFTQNAAYSQVGASSKPATSITFTTTLPQATTITAFEAKFGGFSNTAGDINLFVGETNVGSGSLDATNDVTVTNTTTETGTTLTVTVTNIAKGVKCYYISYTISTSTDPMISAPASIDLASDATAGEIEYSIINPATGVSLEATTTTSWISNIAVDNDKVTFTTTANTETTERQGTITLSYQGADDKDVTIIQAAYVPPVVMENYALFTGNLVEGDYIIYYNGKAMKASLSSGRLEYETVTPSNNVIATDNANIIWHIAPNGAYWTIYNAEAVSYAASTGANNKADLYQGTPDEYDKALWTVSGTEVYEFVNKFNSENDKNANLRNNGTYGFACYATSTGGALTLYKKTSNIVSYNTTITGYGESQNGGFYLIASPVSANPTDVANMMPTDPEIYDLYWFDQANEGAQWRNYKVQSFYLTPGKGYLYARSSDAELTFNGMPYEGNGTINLTYSDGATFDGWNLIGNPFGAEAAISKAYYRMNQNGDGFEAATENVPVNKMEGVFVYASEEGQTVTFTPSNRSIETASIPQINILVSGTNGSVIDNAIVRFDGGSTLEKFSFRESNTKLYIPQGNMDYAIVSSEAKGVMPVNFKAAETGTYTISFSNENMAYNYLHLIDSFTGADIDLLIDNSYTFMASVRDKENRFRVVFNGIDNNINTESDIFAYQSGDEIIVSGEGTLQIFDVMGRFVRNIDVNGTESINAAPFANGVYIFRMVGTDVKTQKIVVR